MESRNQVWRELGVMGNRVFRNCGAYLRIRAAVKGEPAVVGEGAGAGGGRGVEAG